MKKIILSLFVVALATPALACEGFEHSMEALEDAIAKNPPPAAAASAAPQTPASPAAPQTPQVPPPAKQAPQESAPGR